MDRRLYLEAAEQRFTEFGGFHRVPAEERPPMLAEWAGFFVERTEPGLITRVACVPLEAGSLLGRIRDELAEGLRIRAQAERTEALGLLLLVAPRPIDRATYDRVQGLILQSGRVRVVPWIVDLGRGRLFGHSGPPFGVDPDLATLAAPTLDPLVDPGFHSPAARTGPLPRVTVALIALLVGVWVAMTLAGGSLTATEDGALLHRWGAATRPNLLVEGEYWRLLTAGFLHIGLTHLLMNTLSLWWVGQAAEHFFGPARMLAIYLVAQVAGSVASLAFGPPILQVAGASGAIFGLLGALLWYRMAGPERHRLHQVPLLFILLVNLVYGILSYRTVDNWGHLGGLIGGFLAAAALGVPRPDAEPPRKRWARRGAAAALVLAALATLAGWVSVPGPSQSLVRALDAWEQGRLEEAQRGLERAVRAQPDVPMLRLVLAWIYYEEDRIADARAQLDRLFALDPGNADGMRLLQLMDSAGAESGQSGE